MQHARDNALTRAEAPPSNVIPLLRPWTDAQGLCTKHSACTCDRPGAWMAKALPASELRPPSPSTAQQDDGTAFALARRFRSACDKFNTLDERHVALPDTHPEKLATAHWADRAHADRTRLFDAVFARRPETLGDCAALAAHGLHRAAGLLESDLLDMVCAGRLDDWLGQLATAFAGILLVVTEQSGIGICEIGWPDLAAIAKRHTATGRATA